MKHEWLLDEEGEIDIWRVSSNYHNGPECKNCGESFCHHCSPHCYDEECPMMPDTVNRIDEDFDVDAPICGCEGGPRVCPNCEDIETEEFI